MLMWQGHVVEDHDELADPIKQVLNDKLKEILPTYASNDGYVWFLGRKAVYQETNKFALADWSESNVYVQVHRQATNSYCWPVSSDQLATAHKTRRDKQLR